MGAPDRQRSTGHIQAASAHICAANLFNRRNLCRGHIVDDPERADHCRGQTNATKINVAAKNRNEVDEVWIASKWRKGEQAIEKNRDECDGGKAPPNPQDRCSCTPIETFRDYDGGDADDEGNPPSNDEG